MYKKLKINVISTLSLAFFLCSPLLLNAQVVCMESNPIVLAFTDGLTTSDVGQSFEVGCPDGVITSINVWSFTNNTEIDLYIYEGEGFHDPNPYHQSDIKLSAGTPLNNEIVLTTPIAFTNEQKFTFRLQLTGGGSFQLGVSNQMNPYGSGRMYENGIPQPQEDLFFIINTQFTILPVELTQFEVTEKNGIVSLQWQTASETNNLGFEIERSPDARDWEKIGFVNGQGNSQTLNDYAFEDKSPYPGWNYYRLKQVDYDGKFEYSDIQSLHIESTPLADGFTIFPNPASPGQLIQIQFPGRSYDNGLLFLLDARGQRIWRSTISKEQSPGMVLPTALPPGLYSLLLQDDTGKILGAEKLVIGY